MSRRPVTTTTLDRQESVAPEVAVDESAPHDPTDIPHPRGFLFAAALSAVIWVIVLWAFF